MDCVTPILNNTVDRLCKWVAIHCGYVLDLQENRNALREAKLELENISKDVKEKVEITERQGSSRTNQVNGWLVRVELLLKEVEHTIQKADQQIQKKCLGPFCPGNCYSSCKLGKNVKKQIGDVNELIRKGNFEVVAEKLPRPRVDEKPIDKIVGIDSITGEVWNSINDDHSGRDIIGLYGMGGVGKTTLLKKLNNKFLDTDHGFDLVIWVTASKEANLEKIQDVIRRKLSISDDIWQDMIEDDRVAEILRNLRSKKFVMLLDDVWERIDLLNIGVSLNHSRGGSKIIFTTRSEEVCYQMEVQRIVKVDCLTPEAAMDLFRHKVGEYVLNSHPDIPKLAELVCKECKGLPLALVTIGSAMSSRRSPREWQYAIEELGRNPSRFAGMRNDVFPILRFSYDSLSDDILKTCFLYCSLFPEGHNISKDELIELWIGEGFLESSDPRNEGEYIIGTLKLTCLLETGDHSEDFVKMHDVIRDLALWLASENNNKTSVQAHVGSTKSSKSDRWNEAVRMSLWGNVTESIPEAPHCPRLRTLLVRLTVLQTFPSAFFRSMRALEVLDLSYNLDLIRLPEGIGLLRNLHYLNLSHTNIKELSIDIRDLRELKILLLDGMQYLDHIPQGVISSLWSLQVFSFFSTELIELQNPLSNDEAILAEFECLTHMNDLSVTLFSTEAVGRIFYSGLHWCIRRLTIMFFESRSLELRIMFHLETLKIVECFSLQSLNNSDFGGRMPPSFSKLHHVSIISCPKLEELTWLKHAPSLQFLLLRNCVSLYEIIGTSGPGPSEIEESQESLFPNLIEIHLDHLPILTSIFQGTGSFPSLQTMSLTECRMLRKLPFNSESAKCLNSISGSAEWWNQLEWEDEPTKNIFASKFQRSSYYGQHMGVHPEEGSPSISHTPATLSFESLDFPRD